MARRGFTLVELLTVIAIIAILAAIIFPVAGTVRENARRSRCSSNLSQIFVALESYKQDFNAYPPILGAYARYLDGTPITGNCQVASNNVMSFDRAPKPLGNYLKNNEIFLCPNNPVDDKQAITAAVYPIGHALAGNPVRLDPTDPGSPIVCFYRYDSYDIGRLPNGAYELHYTLFWSNNTLNQEENRRENRLPSERYGDGYFDNPVGPKASDTPRQLGYRRPDPTTVVTWCSYHRSYRSGQPVRAKNDLVLFLNGSVKPIDSVEMAQFPYHMRP
ncbi:Type II secretion system protein G [bacterium HR15]|mgnify:CR=1 FL=1|nr:Type II secretion system protein G [bacterium HR15]